MPARRLVAGEIWRAAHRRADIQHAVLTIDVDGDTPQRP